MARNSLIATNKPPKQCSNPPKANTLFKPARANTLFKPAHWLPANSETSDLTMSHTASCIIQIASLNYEPMMGCVYQLLLKQLVSH